MLIAVSGIDGAGKSTQLALLRAELARRGRRPEIVWHRPGYSARLDRARALVRRLYPAALPAADRSGARAAAFARPGVSQGWLLAAWADTLLEYGALVRLRLARGRDVLCDRYLVDARLDLELRFPDQAAAIGALAASLERLCPRPDLHLLLSIPGPERRRRERAKREPYPDPPAIREARHRAYQKLAGCGGLAIVDAGGDIDSVFAAVLARVDEVAR